MILKKCTDFKLQSKKKKKETKKKTTKEHKENKQWL